MPLAASVRTKSELPWTVFVVVVVVVVISVRADVRLRLILNTDDTDDCRLCGWKKPCMATHSLFGREVLTQVSFAATGGHMNLSDSGRGQVSISLAHKMPFTQTATCSY